MTPAKDWTPSQWMQYWRTLPPRAKRELKRQAWQVEANRKERLKWSTDTSATSVDTIDAASATDDT